MKKHENNKKPPQDIPSLSQNRLKQTKRQAPRTAWAKGQTGNPGGRPKFPHEVRVAFQSNTMEAIDTLLKHMRESPNDLVQVRCAETILNRGWGLPAPMEPKAEGASGEMMADFSKLSDKEWEQFKALNHKVLVQKEGQEPNPPIARDQKMYG
jgi:hypothetical protein